MPVGYREAHEAVCLIRSGLVRGWSWEEFQGLPHEFAAATIEVFNALQELEKPRDGEPVLDVPEL